MWRRLGRWWWLWGHETVSRDSQMMPEVTWKSYTFIFGKAATSCHRRPTPSSSVSCCQEYGRFFFFFFFFLLQRVQHLVYRTCVREFSTERSVGCEGATRAKLRKVAEVESTCFRRQGVSCCVALHLLLGNAEKLLVKIE